MPTKDVHKMLNGNNIHYLAFVNSRAGKLMHPAYIPARTHARTHNPRAKIHLVFQPTFKRSCSTASCVPCNKTAQPCTCHYSRDCVTSRLEAILKFNIWKMAYLTTISRAHVEYEMAYSEWKNTPLIKYRKLK